MKNIKKISFFVFVFCLTLLFVPFFDAQCRENIYATENLTIFSEDWANNFLSNHIVINGIDTSKKYLLLKKLKVLQDGD